MTRTKPYLYTGTHKDKLTSTSTHPSKGFGVVYHVKRVYTHKGLSKSPPTNVMEPIMFLSRLLTPIEKSY
jgi:hypothetical protein